MRVLPLANQQFDRDGHPLSGLPGGKSRTPLSSPARQAAGKPQVVDVLTLNFHFSNIISPLWIFCPAKRFACPFRKLHPRRDYFASLKVEVSGQTTTDRSGQHEETGLVPPPNLAQELPATCHGCRSDRAHASGKTQLQPATIPPLPQTLIEVKGESQGAVSS